jgi:hypothetical protein
MIISELTFKTSEKTSATDVKNWVKKELKREERYVRLHEALKQILEPLDKRMIGKIFFTKAEKSAEELGYKIRRSPRYSSSEKIVMIDDQGEVEFQVGHALGEPKIIFSYKKFIGEGYEFEMNTRYGSASERRNEFRRKALVDGTCAKVAKLLRNAHKAIKEMNQFKKENFSSFPDRNILCPKDMVCRIINEL